MEHYCDICIHGSQKYLDKGFDIWICDLGEESYIQCQIIGLEDYYEKVKN